MYIGIRGLYEFAFVHPITPTSFSLPPFGEREAQASLGRNPQQEKLAFDDYLAQQSSPVTRIPRALDISCWKAEPLSGELLYGYPADWRAVLGADGFISKQALTTVPISYPSYRSPFKSWASLAMHEMKECDANSLAEKTGSSVSTYHHKAREKCGRGTIE